MFNLLVYLTIFLIVNFILITIVWNYYSTKIQLLITKKGEKEQVLEQLRMESIELKLPKDYTPRI